MSLYASSKSRRKSTTTGNSSNVGGGILTPSNQLHQSTNNTTTNGISLGLSDEQRQEVKEAFELFDTDKDGAIDYHELKVSMRALGFDLKKPEVLKLLREYDRRGEGLMEFEDFLKISEFYCLLY